MLHVEWRVTTERAAEGGRSGWDRAGLDATLRHLADRGDESVMVSGYEYGIGTRVDLTGLRS